MLIESNYTWIRVVKMDLFGTAMLKEQVEAHNRLLDQLDLKVTDDYILLKNRIVELEQKLDSIITDFNIKVTAATEQIDKEKTAKLQAETDLQALKTAQEQQKGLALSSSGVNARKEQREFEDDLLKQLFLALGKNKEIQKLAGESLEMQGVMVLSGSNPRAAAKLLIKGLNGKL